jgi:hypothetical protein
MYKPVVCKEHLHYFTMLFLATTAGLLTIDAEASEIKRLFPYTTRYCLL